MAWQTQDPLVAQFGESLVKRARKRSVSRKDDGAFVVVGDEKLNDAYPYYTVRKVSDSKYVCSCQSHQGGKYRKVCSHIVASMIKDGENGDGQDKTGCPHCGKEGVHTCNPPAAQPTVTDSPDSPVEPSPGPRERRSESPRPMTAQGGNGRSQGRSGTSANELQEGGVRGAYEQPDWMNRTASFPAIPPVGKLDVGDSIWGYPRLPGWLDELREHQITAVKKILAYFQAGTRTIFLDAPTGSGKTLIAECVRRLMNVGTVYTCSTKGLQDQFLDDYPYASLLKGRSNYPTYNYPDQFNDTYDKITCGDCPGPKCNLCPDKDHCPYERAKTRAIRNQLAVVNTSYLLSEANRGPGRLSGRGLNIVDECDLLEGELMNHVQISISPYRQRRHNIPKPKKKTVEESWLDWVQAVKPIVKSELDRIPEHTQDKKKIRDRKYLDNLLHNLSLLHSGLENEDTQWVYTGYDDDRIVFKPVMVSQFGPRYLWRHGERWLLMSASIISSKEMADSLGLEDQYDTVQVPSTFPVENRKVYVNPVEKIISKNRSKAYIKLKNAILHIMDMHPDDNILIHTVSYRLANHLTDKITPRTHRPVYSYTRSADREEALESFRQDQSAIMFAPSLDRGVDLRDDECRVQIVAKVPYPYLGDKQVQHRLYGTKGGSIWYKVQTVRSLVQMTGRAVRHQDDYCTTYILDRKALDLYNENRSLFPSWWREGLQLGRKSLTEKLSTRYKE